MLNLADDAFNSNSQNGRLAYTMPSIMDLMAATYDKFDGETLPLGLTQEGLDSLSFTAKVFNGESAETIECA